MKKRALVLAVVFCITAAFLIPCFQFTVSGAATENIEDLEKLESIRNEQKTKADGDASYATLPHEGAPDNGTFVTVFTVGFMIVLVIAGAFVLFYKR
ncbi:MAG: hypothetical protein IJS94_02205 [Clostridia bacterium]|nr:hypothetical protein [Clostridia bacterium]